jgi:hypothetical protein
MFNLIVDHMSVSYDTSSRYSNEGKYISPIIYLRTSFIYRGKEYKDQRWTCRIEYCRIEYQDGVRTVRFDSFPSCYSRDFIHEKAYSEKLRVDSRAAVVEYVLNHISPKDLETDLLSSALNRLNSIEETLAKKIEDLQAELKHVKEQACMFGSSYNFDLNKEVAFITDEQYSVLSR